MAIVYTKEGANPEESAPKFVKPEAQPVGSSMLPGSWTKFEILNLVY